MGGRVGALPDDPPASPPADPPARQVAPARATATPRPTGTARLTGTARPTGTARGRRATPAIVRCPTVRVGPPVTGLVRIAVRGGPPGPDRHPRARVGVRGARRRPTTVPRIGARVAGTGGRAIDTAAVTLALPTAAHSRLAGDRPVQGTVAQDLDRHTVADRREIDRRGARPTGKERVRDPGRGRDPDRKHIHDRPRHSRPRTCWHPTRNWSPAAAPSRRSSPPAAPRTACSSSRSGARRSSNSCSTPRGCASRSSRSRAAR